MKKIILLIALLLGTYAFAQCPNDNVPYGTTIPTCDGVVYTATTCIFGGEYRTVDVTAGNEYMFETCGDTDFDTQLSVYGAGGNLLAYNDDYCGLQSHVTFIATVTESIHVNVDRYYCTSETACMTLKYSCTVLDDPPVISCPTDVVADSEPGVCGAVVSFADAVAIDTEDGVLPTTQTMGPASGSVFPVGVTIVEFSATDSVGQTSTCQFTVTVNDIEDPVAVCQDITIELDASGMATIVAADIDGGSTDNCGTPTIEFGGGSTVPHSITTTFAGGNGNFGNMFDVMAVNALVVDSFDINADTGATFDVEVYAKVGTWVGSEATPGDWTLIGTALGVVSMGDGVATPLNLSLGYAIPAGETHAFYVTPTDFSTGGLNYTNGSATGNLFVSDSNIEVYEGGARGYPLVDQLSNLVTLMEIFIILLQ